MNIKEKILKAKQQLILKENGNNKKTVENLAVFIIILIITIIAINYIWNDKEENKNTNKENVKVLATAEYKENETNEINDDMSTKLENILKNIKGVGNVKVLITYSQTSKVVPLYSEDISEKTTEENDSRRRNQNNK